MQNSFGPGDQRPTMHFFFLLDVSGSMTLNHRIETLNEAIPNVCNALEDLSRAKSVDTILHFLSFSNNMTWLLNTSATSGISAAEAAAQWSPLTAFGGTDMAKAIRELVPGMSRKYLGHKTFRPVIIMVSDAEPNDPTDAQAAINELDRRQKTMRIGIGVEDFDRAQMEAFASMGQVAQEDSFGNTTDPVRQPLIFDVDKATDLTSVLRSVAMSSLLASIVIGAEAADPATPEQSDPVITIKEENPDEGNDTANSGDFI